MSKIVRENRTKEVKNIFQKVFLTFVALCLTSTTLATSYLYTTSEISESSISTATSTPEFSFSSAAQILMEPSTGTIIYANNENEKLLPASVTKVMTY